MIALEQALAAGAVTEDEGERRLAESDLLIDEVALDSGLLGGFAADVNAGELDHQPPAELLAFDNVILTPHTSGQSERLPTARWRSSARTLRRCLDGRPLLNLVDWERGY
ncbi:MAG: hypothetical protein M3O34_09950 [Chloroflexota bacterium]|nr:hypothetical protein [Chloroflexota bacterium]